MARTRNYTEDFMIKAVNLANQSGNITRTAKELGTPEAMLHTRYNKVKMLS